MPVWEEIRGFASPGEYERFLQCIEGQLARGHARERSADPSYAKGAISGGRWFEDIESGTIWRLVPADPPFSGLWEPI